MTIDKLITVPQSLRKCTATVHVLDEDLGWIERIIRWELIYSIEKMTDDNGNVLDSQCAIEYIHPENWIVIDCNWKDVETLISGLYTNLN